MVKVQVWDQKGENESGMSLPVIDTVVICSVHTEAAGSKHTVLYVQYI